MIVIAKAFNDESLKLAYDAFKAEIPVFIDVCDNIFVDEYVGGFKGVNIKSKLYALNDLAQGLIVPTRIMGEVLCANLRRDDASIHVIPDGLESQSDIKKLLAATSKASRKLYSGVTLIPKTSGSMLNNRPSASSLSRAKHNVGSLKARFKQALHHPNKIIPYFQRRLQGISSLTHTPASVAPKEKRKKEVGGVVDIRGKKSKSQVKRILWFGNAGRQHGDYGISTLLRVKDALEKIARERQIVLIVVSNDKDAYGEYINPIHVDSKYIEWSPVGIYKQISSADLVLIPNSKCEFSKSKSSNRAVLSLSLGISVLAEPCPGLEELNDYIAVNDWYHDICTHLDKGKSISEEVESVLEKTYSDDAIGEKYLKLIQNTKANDLRAKKKILFVLDLIQDLEVIKSILIFLANQNSYRVHVLASKWLIANSQKAADSLEKINNIELDVRERSVILTGKPDYLINVAVIFFASETTLGPHKVAHRIATIARKRKIQTLTFQHGFENVGLSYFDGQEVGFASDKILTWSDLSRFQNKMSSDTCEKLVPIGLFKSFEQNISRSELVDSEKYNKVVGVFENLHWDRYSEAFRRDFVVNLVATAKDFPGICFLLKTHPAGQWVKNHLDSIASDNILIVDGAANNYSIYQILGVCDAVITTPSTVAIDACLAKVPISIVGDADEMLDLSLYQPLRILTVQDHWKDFISSIQRQPDLSEALNHKFIETNIRKLNPLEELQDQFLLQQSAK